MKSYIVYGDMTAERSSDAYPMMTLCDECVENYEIVTEEGSASGPCDDCGSDGDEEE